MTFITHSDHKIIYLKVFFFFFNWLEILTLFIVLGYPNKFPVFLEPEMAEADGQGGRTPTQPRFLQNRRRRRAAAACRITTCPLIFSDLAPSLLFHPFASEVLD